MADFESAKAFLLQASDHSGLSVYEHLSTLITRLLDERPNNAADVVEQLSFQIKADKFAPEDSLKDQPETPDNVLTAKARSTLLKHETEIPEDEAEPEQVVPNLLDLARYFADADVGLGEQEMFRIFLALKQLAEQQPLKSVTFWGKIFGTEQDYIIAEAEYREGEEPQPEEEERPDEQPETPDEGEEDEENGVTPLPKSTYKPPPDLPTEEYGAGTNKKVYFVCNEPGQEWHLLPNVKPKHISVCRQIRKRFTGRLDAPVVAYPPFAGTEMELLRAQIARITAGTHVSPVGYFTFDEEEDDGDDEARDNFIVDEEFEGKSLAELLEADLSGWVHHAPYILPQGRSKWVNPNLKGEEDELDEEDEDEDEEEEEEIEPEAGPPLLTPLQNDDDVDGLPAWSTRLSSTAHPAYACVRVSSNRWPGAHAFAVDRKFANIYIGDGLKYQAEPFSPQLPPPAQVEYSGEDVAEAVDPTRQEEEEFEAQMAEEEEDDLDDEDEDEDD
ncbi:hypothetical protein PTSG_01550 [Salpingoeca rosetta]|uniref:Uncharacterized protein n=1 Tax=Salpingoeca rosetta (strain ATCC 50818 / BSB-021) TaxID=946362 RepID=F2U0P0_SALR5|nr:uncharacterized protein PTSG_01550 [Salpingoeca rosetta]EGD80968.1 hypothetical protein PTSG_01550 [Salpingoeca rosetta]|eukprot:XP_004997529.1 hypothetical protein PTSG_01550 [Salpingoeca rosetta]